MTKGWYYDGQSATRHAVELAALPSGLELRSDAGLEELFPWAELEHRGERPNGAVYGHKTRKGLELGILDPISDDIVVHLPKPRKYGGIIDRIGLFPAIGLFTAVSALTLFVVTKVPEFLAPLIPMSWEKKLGDAMVGDFGGRICHGPGSDAALAALTDRLDVKGSELSIRIANIKMVNAVALPGGNIIVFQGLLKEAKSPDELAGVLGHEIGHVRNRDVMQSLLRQLGLSVVLGGANSNAGSALNSVVSSTYSREAEAKADTYSIEVMRKANISAADTAGFFARLAKEEKDLGRVKAALGYLASHPLSETREKKFKDSVKAGTAYAPALTPLQWKALIDSCANDPKVKKDDGFFF